MKLLHFIKKTYNKFLIIFKYHNQNILNRNLLNKEDKKSLNSNQINETNVFWRNYTNKFNIKYTKYYTSMSSIYSKYYIPDNLYYSYIDVHYNSMLFEPGVDVKAYYDFILPEIKMAKTVFRKLNGFCYNHEFILIDEIESHKELKLDNEYILKPAYDSQGGKGIVFFNTDKLDDVSRIISDNNNFIIQYVVKQHRTLSKLHPNSLNTIRVISLLLNNSVYILSSVLRIGVSGSRVDNASSGGIVVGIDGGGKLKKYAYSIKDRNKYERHPDSHVELLGYEIPSYDKVIDIIKTVASKFPFFRLISWDFAIDEAGEPTFIEFNLKNGQLDFHQFCNGPLFGDLTEEVLEEVFLKK